MPGPTVAVINYSSPELNYLAAELARSGQLIRYVRPYANQGRGWERLLERLPASRGLYGSTLGRRTLPPGFSAGQVDETVMILDFLNAALRKIPVTICTDLAESLHWQMRKRVAAVGARHTAGAKAVVASYLVAKPGFERTTGRRVLNYPSAHHHYIDRLVAEEAQREPGFASTLPGTVPDWVGSELNAECELADFILLGSTFARDSFIAENLPRAKLLVIPFGANLSRFSPRSEPLKNDDAKRPRAGLRVLFVGRLSQLKGISYLLRAYSAFHSPGTELTLVGNYSGDRDALASYRHLFRHIPHVAQPVLADLYRGADVFVFPTLFEGLGLVVLEAMASGLPVITTPNGPGDVVRDGVDGFVIPIRDEDAIREKLEFFRSNPERRAEMGRNARERALAFSWEAYQERTSSFLLKLTGGDR